MKSLYAVVALFAFLFVGAGISNAQTSDVFLNGHGISSSLSSDITIYVSRVAEGAVHGGVVVKDNYQGDAVELIPPSGTVDYWCINHLVESVPGFNNIIFVKDVPAGDQISFTGGMGMSCASAGVPTPASFDLIDTGGFVGEVVTDTCAGDLATCNSNLNQCLLDLVDCTDVCELPVLPANYSAKLTGKGFYPPDSGDVKVTAIRKKNSPLDDFSGKMSSAGKWQSGVTNVVAPSDGKPNWCMEGTITSAVVNPSLVGKKVVVYVNDISKHYDLMSVQIDVGLTCGNTSPGVLTLVDGEFIGGKVIP